MKKITTGIAITAGAMLIGMTISAQAADFRMMTGSQGGSYFPLGGALKGFIEKDLPDVNIEVMHGGGVGNLKALEAGKTTIGFCNSVSTIDAIEGKKPFSAPAKNICNVGSLYNQYFQIITLKDSGLKSVADFKGLSLATQTRGTTGEAVLNLVLNVYGMNYDDLAKVHQVGYSDAVSLMKDGHAKAFTLVTTAPAGAVMDLASARDISLLPIPADMHKKAQAIMPGMLYGAIPGGTYPGVSTDTPALTFFAHVAVRCDAPDDLVYSLTKAIAEHESELSSIAKAVKGLDLKRMATDVGAPFHKAAIKYYKEKGAM